MPAALEIVNCELGTISSRQDHSCTFKVVTPELRVSEAGQLMQWHGRACTVSITPHDGAPAELVRVDTERRTKSKGERLRGVHWLGWQRQGSRGDFETWYSTCFEKLMDDLKAQLD
jgi:hypothetical protein